MGNYKMKTILVTGAAGFIGYHLCEKLLQSSYNVVGLDNINGYYDPLLEMFDRAVEQRFMRDQHRQLWVVAHTAEEAVDLWLSLPDWDPNLRKFAAI